VVLVATLVAATPLVAGAAVLERVRVRADGGLRVELVTSGPVVPWVRRLPASAGAPDRIYVDLADTVLGPGVRKVLVSGRRGLVRVRAGQFTPTTARIVLDTSAELAFDVATTDREVAIVLAGLPETKSAPAPTITRPAAPPSTIAAAPPSTAAASPPLTVAAVPPEAGTTVPLAMPVPPPANASTVTSTSAAAPAKPAAAKATPPETAPEPPPAPPELPLIVVDAGHGGHDPGAEGIDGVQEKTIALQMAHRLAAKLPARLPVDSLLTRSDDSFVPLHERLPHRDRPRTLFVSLHANACEDGDPRGVEVFFGSRHGTRASVDSKHLARLITTELRARLLRVRGRPRHGPFRVLTSNPAPSVLVEVGYLTHREDAARLQDAKYQELFTDALVDAVAAYLQSATDPTMQAGQTLVPSGEEPRTISARIRS
jgi:N-acetylmuramoyl-L-alanine amidase